MSKEYWDAKEVLYKLATCTHVLARIVTRTATDLSIQEEDALRQIKVDMMVIMEKLSPEK